MEHRMYAAHNYFSLEAKAQQIADQIQLRLEMQKWADENCPDMDWDGIDLHFYILYNDQNEVFTVNCTTYHKCYERIYFGTREGAEQAIQIFGTKIKYYNSKYLV